MTVARLAVRNNGRQVVRKRRCDRVSAAEARDRRNSNVARGLPRLPGASLPMGSTLPLVRIYRPARSAMQSGWRNTRAWVLEFEPSAPLTPEPLMGWTGSQDPLAHVQVRFPDLQSAIGFAERHGWHYHVDEPAARRVPPKSYADRFKHEQLNAVRGARASTERVAGGRPLTNTQRARDDRKAPRPASRTDQSQARDPVEEAGLASFPASDPPSWTASTAGR